MCPSRVRIMLKQIRRLFARNNNNNNNTDEVEVNLHYKIIANILDRLPAKTVIVCEDACKPLLDFASTPSFIDLHLDQPTATPPPVIAFHCQPPERGHDNCEGNEYTQVVDICFTPQNKSDNHVIRSTPIDVCADHCVSRNCSSVLYGSCNGLLLFQNPSCWSLLSIWNPVTGEQNTIISTLTKWCRVHGFFFHPKAQDYKVVFQSIAPEFGVNCFEYHIYSCKTKTSRLIQRYSYASTGDKNPILLNGVLHWMVYDSLHKQVQGVYPSCSNSILLFDIYTEKFSTMSHPGGQCSEEGCHHRMQLMENEGHLYFCNPSASQDIVIWKLEDYKHKVWVQRHVIQEPNKGLFGDPLFGLSLLPLDMHKDEIIILVGTASIFLYNMSSCKFRRIGKQFPDLSVFTYPFYHVDSLVSLHKNN